METDTLEVLDNLIKRISNEIATLRLVRESYKKSGEVRYLRMTAADALASSAKKLILSGTSKRMAVKVMHAMQMYAQPELSNPLEELEDSEMRRRREEIDRLQRRAQEILSRLQELSIF